MEMLKRLKILLGLMPDILEEYEGEIEILEFFKTPKTEKDACQMWGDRTGDRIFNRYFSEGFIEDIKDRSGYYQLSETGKNHLIGYKEAYKKKKKDNFWNKPLNVAIIGAIIGIILTALIVIPLTYKITTRAIDYEKILTVSLYGKEELTLRPGEYFPFNSLILYNPTNNKVTLENIYIKNDYNWIRWKEAQKEKAEQKNSPSEENKTIEYDLPELKTDYKPYMELDAGESRIMEGLFSLYAPIKTGEYKLSFYAETLDGKQYGIDRPIIIKVVEE